MYLKILIVFLFFTTKVFSQLDSTIIWIDKNSNWYKVELRKRGTLFSKYEVKNNLLQGTMISFYDTKFIKSIEEYNKGLKNGLAIYFNAFGVEDSSMYYVNDTLNGKQLIFKNNSVQNIKNFKAGKLDGLYQLNYELSNFPMLKVEYKNGFKNGLYQMYYKGTQLQYEATYVNDILNGFTRNIYENNQVESTGYYAENKESGIWNYWNPNGKLVKTVNYNTNKKRKRE